MGLLETQLAQFAEALLAESRHVNRRSYRQQRLISADIGGGSLATDVLLARLQRQHVAGAFIAAFFDGLPDESAWEQAHVFVTRCHEAQRGAAVAHGIAEAH